ncbi:MAG: glutamate-5-semialdehyde dehydrogenase [Eubacteriales bacterium]
MERKSKIRKESLLKRRSLKKEEWSLKSQLIVREISKMDSFLEAKQILLYAPYDQEVDVSELAKIAYELGKKVYYPRVEGENIAFYEITYVGELERGYCGICEPREGLPSYTQKHSSCCIVPGVSFDGACNRMGYGKGFYDRFLTCNPNITTIGVGFQVQIMEQVPCDENDVPLDYVVTEKGMVRTMEHKILEQIGEQAVAATYELQGLDTVSKNQALAQVAKDLVDATNTILKSNELDIQAGIQAGMSEGLLDRLRLTKERIVGMAEGMTQIIALEDPIGEILDEVVRDNGLRIRKIRVPIGVIGMIYESRPNVTLDAFALCFKAGNVVILKGGSDAIHSNIAIANCIRTSLEIVGISPNVIQLIEDTNREVTKEFMKMNEYIDVLIPRGGAGLIQAVVTGSTIPVIETGTGNCHIYVDKEADYEKAIPIILNAKTQRVGVCNACESLVIHKDIAEEFLPLVGRALVERGVEIRGDEVTCNKIPEAKKAMEEDYSAEYLALCISSKVVDSLQEAIYHINHHHTKHSDVIITENSQSAALFLQQIDSACVYHNASSRFSDGFEFGLGAEIGISTQKIHARGPMGLKEITSYKYIIEGNGQVR